MTIWSLAYLVTKRIERDVSSKVGASVAVLACLLGVLHYTWKSGVRVAFVSLSKMLWGTLTMLVREWLLSPPVKNAESRSSVQAVATTFILISEPVDARLVKYKGEVYKLY